MPLDVIVFDENYRYEKHIHIDKAVHGLLFRKLVTEEDYPALGKAREETEDITFTPKEIPSLVKDLDKLEKYVKKTKKMSDEVKGICMGFIDGMKEVCKAALESDRNVEFVAGE